MRTVWKYELTNGRNDLRIPFDAEILSAKGQHDSIVLYALIGGDNVHDEGQKRIFYVVETGENINNHSMARVRYIDTCLLYGGTYVVHVFEGQ